MQDYRSSLSDPASRKFETFSYLPAMSAEQIRKQVEYILARGWNPAIEHTEPEHAVGSYWYMWKLPMFGETTSSASWPRPRPATRRTPRTTCAWSATTTSARRRARRW